MKDDGMDLAWAEQRWTDSDTGAEVVCLSPPHGKAHFRNPYFRINMFTADGRYAVFCEHERLEAGEDRGPKRLWARDLADGRLVDLGEIPPSTHAWIGWAVAPRSRRVTLLDRSDPACSAIVQIDIDSGRRRRIVPAPALAGIYDATISADERCIFTPHYGPQFAAMPHAQRVARPPPHDMVRIDLATGAVTPVFTADGWLIGHPNPHPRDPDLLMCCQEWHGEEPDSAWGRAREHERIRVRDLAGGRWLDTFRHGPWQSTHEHWAIGGRRIYAHGWIHGLNAIHRIDLAAATNRWFLCPPDTGDSIHVRVAPNERFVVGDGANFDRHTVPPDLRARIAALADSPDFGAQWARADLERTSGGETIWKYELPSESLWDPDRHGQDPERLRADLAAQPERSVQVSAVCRFRTLGRTLMLGRRLESNAQVTPDSRWVVFQSSSPADRFQVWAARVPGEP